MKRRSFGKFLLSLLALIPVSILPKRYDDEIDDEEFSDDENTVEVSEIGFKPDAILFTYSNEKPDNFADFVSFDKDGFTLRTGDSQIHYATGQLSR